MTSQAQVIKTSIPNPPPSVPALLATVREAVEELKAKDVVEIDVRGKRLATNVTTTPFVPHRYFRGS